MASPRIPSRIPSIPARDQFDSIEIERRRLAAELHDRTGANLATIGLNLASLARALAPLTSEQDELLRETRGLLSDTLASIRELCVELRPSLLEHAGLEQGLRQIAQLFAKRTGIAVELDFKQYRDRLAPAVELAMLRIAQEALQNCAKHSGAFKIKLSCTQGAAQTSLHIVDDGRGFDPGGLGNATVAPGIGILNMRERAASVGSSFSLESEPGGGTRIEIVVRSS